MTPSKEEHGFYRHVMDALEEQGIPFLVGGAFAYGVYTRIERDTKDVDLFVRPADADRILQFFSEQGYRTEKTYPLWIGKIMDQSGAYVDILYNSANGVCPVDEEWFTHAKEHAVLGTGVKIVPPEEMLWQKAFIQERERYDGADMAHLLRAMAPLLDWERLLRRFGDHWRVLYAHLVLYGYIYPGERVKIPASVLAILAERMAAETAKGNEDTRVCNGTLLSRAQYLNDIGKWGYKDARLRPIGPLTAEQITHWTAGIAVDGSL